MPPTARGGGCSSSLGAAERHDMMFCYLYVTARIIIARTHFPRRPADCSRHYHNRARAATLVCRSPQQLSALGRAAAAARPLEDRLLLHPLLELLVREHNAPGHNNLVAHNHVVPEDRHAVLRGAGAGWRRVSGKAAQRCPRGEGGRALRVGCAWGARWVRAPSRGSPRPPAGATSGR